ncbi:MAG: hypothetical protein ACI81I_000585 [Arcobacteraceae bacterium]|jgi:hypothetical protein
MRRLKSLVIYLLLLTSVSFIISGCSVKMPDKFYKYEIPPYSASSDNVMEMKTIKTKINIGKFTSYNKDEKPGCRLGGGYITTQDGISLDTYIEKAFIKELKLANIYDEKAKITLSGYIKEYISSSSLSDAYWTININIKSNNGKQFNVVHTTKYDSSFLGMTACYEDMPSAFKKTVKELILNIITHRKFQTLLK